MTSEIHIAYCFDRHYYQHFGASATSLLKNFDADRGSLHVHIFTDADDAGLKQKLWRLQDAFGAKFEVHVLSAQDIQVFNGLPLFENITIANYFRFLIADLLPVKIKRVIYLDADTIVLSSIRKLYEEDMQHRTIAGAIDFSAEPMQQRLGVKRYINAGVLLIDLQQWREKNYSRLCIDYARTQQDKIVFADQCVLNSVLQEDMHILPKKWNTFILPDERSGSIEEAAIIHFITSDKPWQSWYENPAAEIYWRFLHLSPWRGAVATPPPQCFRGPQVRPAVAQARPTGKVYCDLRNDHLVDGDKPKGVNASSLSGPEMITSQEALHRNIEHRDICHYEMRHLIRQIMDGEIMGVRHRGFAVEGVQFHPESIRTEHGYRLLKNFLQG